MNLLGQLLQDLGVGENKSFTVILNYGVYFQGVKKIISCSEEEFVLSVGKEVVRVFGTGLEVGKFFQSDLLLLGDVKGVSVEKNA